MLKWSAQLKEERRKRPGPRRSCYGGWKPETVIIKRDSGERENPRTSGRSKTRSLGWAFWRGLETLCGWVERPISDIKATGAFCIVIGAFFT